MTPTWDARFLALAEHVAQWSKDPSTKTGAVIVRYDRRIISMGYNGFPQNMKDTPELYEDKNEKYSRIVHCEMNALLFAQRSVQDCILYTWPFLSCDRCFVVMAQAGISRFVAPKPSLDIESRWAGAMHQVRRYAKEMHIDLVEL